MRARSSPPSPAPFFLTLLRFFAHRLIQEFKAGLLPLTDGTTLRTFLSIMLNCDPMRISKKFVGSNCIGKQVRGTDGQQSFESLRRPRPNDIIVVVAVVLLLLLLLAVSHVVAASASRCFK